jgi:HSP20 family molecular chaperone IbpA
MSEKTAMKTRETSALAAERAAAAALLPPVDIFEDARGITLKADLPGVSKDRLSVQVDKDVLTIEGEALIEMPEGMEALYADLRSTRFRRSFTLSPELEADRIEAEMRDSSLRGSSGPRTMIRNLHSRNRKRLRGASGDRADPEGGLTCGEPG